MTFRAVAATVFLLCATTLAQAADRAIIVLDASGSMWGQIDGQAKITIARQTLRNVLKSVPPTLELGLIAYGHREKASCSDIQLIVPPAAGTSGAIVAAANGLTPKGKTPLTEAVRQAAEALKFTEDKATVILITDGLETCDADPCAVATELEKDGVDLTVHVVGFGLSASEGKQVACLAENTGGKYFSADNAAGLGKALTETVAEVEKPTPAPPPPPPPPPAPPATPDKDLKVTAHPAPGVSFADNDTIRYDVYTATIDGHEADAVETSYGDGGGPEEFDLPAGKYVVVGSHDLASGEVAVDVSEDKETTVDVILNAATVTVHAMMSESVPAPEGAAFRFVDAKGGDETNYGASTSIMLNAGDGTVTVSLGAASVDLPFTVVAGQNQDLNVVLDAGTLVLRGKRSADASDTDDGIRWDVMGDGIDQQTTYGGEATFYLPSGDYTATASLGEATASADASIAVGETITKDIVVATGRLVAHALFSAGGPTVTNGPHFDVLASEPGADGQRKVLGTTYDDGATFDLPPGKYVLRAGVDLAEAEMDVEVKAGVPSEYSVVLNAGLLAVTAPGGDAIDLLSSKKDIYGKQPVLTTAYGESWQVTAPVGDYIVKVKKTDGTEASAPATITAGERTEVTVQ